MNLPQDSGNLSRFGNILKKHWLAGSLAFIAVFGLGASATSLRKDIYQAEAKLKFNSADSQVDVPVARDRSRLDISKMRPRDSLVATEVATLRSRSLIGQTLTELKQQDALDHSLAVSELRRKLRVSVLPNTNLVKVVYTSEDPQQAVVVVNTLVENYLELIQTRKREAIVATTNLWETQLAELEQAIAQTESAIRKLQETNNFVALRDQAQILLQSEQQLTQKINQIRGELIKGQAQADYLRQHLESNSTTTEDGKGDRANEALRSRLNQNLIQLEANNLGLQQQSLSLEKFLADYQAQIRQIPELESQLRQLDRKLQAYQFTYDTIWQELTSLKFNLNPNSATMSVISDAVVTPNWIYSRSVAYLGVLGLALLSAIGVATWRGVRDRSISTIEEAKQIYGDAWLGIIPNIRQLPRLTLPDLEAPALSIPKLIVRDYPTLPSTESYRMLQSNLKFLHSERAVKTITITSSAAQEGKSTVTANLASAMAQVGNRVLVVDANLHSPMQHLIWDTGNDPGLSNVVAEQLNPRIAVQQVMSNLDLIVAGTGFLASGTLLDSPRLRMLVDYWSEQYDLVLFDTPPLGMAADAAIMSRMTDGVLLVVRPGFVERPQATFAQEILAQPGFNLLGVVFNCVSSQFAVTPSQNPALNQKSPSKHRQLRQGTLSIPDRLWENLTAVSHQPSEPKLPKNLDEPELLIAPLKQLENTVHALQQDLGELTLLVKEQEEELFNQRQRVKQLQRQANIASENEYFHLEHQINQEQEKKRMLDQTLVGQRRNLSQRRQILYKYQEVLASRKYSDSHSASG